MDLPHLKAYIDQKNRIMQAFARPGCLPNLFDITNRDDLKAIASMVASDLSPENISCDGELTGTALKVKRAGLMMVARDLATLVAVVV